MADEPSTIAARLFRLSTGVFFMGGFTASILNLLVPRLRIVFGLDYAAATSVQLATHSSYLVFALPIAAIVSALGYMRAHAGGLLLMATGLMGVAAGLYLASFPIMLAALVAISAGATFLQIASNLVVTIVGDPARAAVRLNLLQGLNSLGTVLGPLLAAGFLLGDRAGSRPITAAAPFLGTAAAVAVLAVAFWRARDLLGPPIAGLRTSPDDWRRTLKDGRLRFGLLAMFAYVGAEVTIGALMANFLMQPGILGADAVAAGRLVGLYWALAMVGRFAGAYLLRRSDPGRLLRNAAIGAICCAGGGISMHGGAAAAALLAVGLFNSVMYPTIYVLALPREPRLAVAGSTLLCMAVVGGAVVPVVTGFIADALGLSRALAVPTACYLVIAVFGASGLSKSPDWMRRHETESI